MNPYSLPKTASIGGRSYPISWDYRDILEIIDYLNNPGYPMYLRWHIALNLFYEGDVPEELGAAMDFLTAFIGSGKPGPKLFDWTLDADAILSDVNRVAGREIRGEEKLHWWTFLSFFHSIGQGQLSLRVGIRDKLRRGQKLESWEQEYYRANRDIIRMTADNSAEKQRLEALLN